MTTRRKSTASLLVALLVALAWSGMNATGESSNTAVQSSRAAPDVGSGVDRVAPEHWVVDPLVPGDDLPPRGRSLFDFLASEEQGGELRHTVPFPFSALLQRIESRARSASDSRGRPVKAVLVPLGRSLQRNSAAPEFFAYPRIVVAVDSEPAGAGDPYLKDRLYLGYQEKADLIEVISYNEDAGRFEFQVVSDYRRGGIPRIVYANRTLCLACHQNAAPIFSRAVWDETNANPRVAALLASARKDFHGIPVDRGIDVPNAIDDATLRANRFAVNQLLWQQGCGGNDEPAVTCRAGLFAAVLQYRLSGQQHFDRADPSYRDNVAARMTSVARRQWPGGLALGNPDLPNRNPLAGETAMSPVIAVREAANLADVGAAFDPLLPRPPLEVWRFAGQDDVARLVAGLSDFIAAPDVERLDAALRKRAESSGTARRTYRGICKIHTAPAAGSGQRVEFRCASSPTAVDRGVALEGRLIVAGTSVSRGTIDRVEFDGQSPLRDLDLDARRIDARGTQRVAVLAPMRGSVRARGADGNAVERMELRWSGSEGAATFVVVDDFAAARRAIGDLARDALAGKFDGFEAQPLRRARLMPALFGRLGEDSAAWCCLAAAGMPPARAARVESADAPGSEGFKSAMAASHAGFFRYCSECHSGSERAPPNFLLGDADEVEAKLRHCAPRIYFRLSMWQRSADARAKTPMPPDTAVQRFKFTPAAWRDGGALSGLISSANERLRAEAGAAQGDALLRQSYQSLRACLPDEPGATLPERQAPEEKPARHAATRVER